MSEIRQHIEQYEDQYFRSLNLVASENLSSEDVRYALSSDLHHRYAIPPEGKRPPEIWDYPNQDIIHKIIDRAENLACDIYGATAANLFPLSGNQIAQIILMNFLKEGDTFLSVGGHCGGHFTTQKVADRVGLNRVDLPYDFEAGVIDIEKAADIIKREKPKLIFLDASMILFPYPVSDLKQICSDDVVISYDASHTMGLIGGGQFQSPLNEGADLLHGSTHKSLWGPQKGMILANTSDEKASRAFWDIVPFFASNVHTHHVAALGIALEELHAFGKDYAYAVVQNARTLAKAVDDNGLNVAFAHKGYTDCHQVIVKIGSKSEAQGAFYALQETGINTNAIRLPFSQTGDEFGLRIGLSELTRRGLRENQIEIIAGLIADVILDRRSIDAVKADVMKISSMHPYIRYTFDETTADILDWAA